LIAFRIRAPLFVLLAGLCVAVWANIETASVASVPLGWGLLWNHYAAHFIDPQGRVIDYEDAGVTTSEGEAYALFFALVDNDPVLFGKILSWTQSNLAQGSLASHLPSWRWGLDKKGRWGVLDANSASDADTWMAYTLIQAGRLWHDPRYAALGKLMSLRIAQEEVVDLQGLGPTLLPGPKGFHLKPQEYVLNPSYLPLFLLNGLATAVPSGPWAHMAVNLPNLLQSVAPEGFAPDWVAYVPGKGFGVAPQGPEGSYNAIRVYLWAGITNPKTPGSAQVLAAVWGMGKFLQTHILPPVSVNTSNGMAKGNGPVGFSAAVMPYLKRMGMQEPLGNQNLRLTADFDPHVGLYGNPPRYYDQNLALFALGWLQGAFHFAPNGNLEAVW